MTKRKTFLIAGMLAILLLGIVPLAAFAQPDDGPHPDPWHHLTRALIDTAAQTLNMEPQALLQAMREGKSPTELAQEAGVAPETLQAALQETWNAQGEIIIGQFMEHGLPPKPHRPPKAPLKHLRQWTKISAETLDMPVQDFVQAMREGQTPAQIAEAHGSSGQALVDAIVAAEKARLDQAVADGKITQERADRILARVTEKAGRWVEHGIKPHQRQRPPRP